MIFVLAAAALVFWWRRSRSRFASRRERALTEAMPDCIDLLMATLRAGYSPAQGIRFLGMHAPLVVRPAFIAASRRVDEGERFVEALRHLQNDLGDAGRAMCEVLVASDRSGIPVESLLFQLGNDARLGRRRASETIARQLPVKLSLPLVTCTLPSFIVLIIVPTIAGTLSQLRVTV